ncbi:MAG: hypothetical protein V2A69_10570 [Pseudomonadota bacterium]
MVNNFVKLVTENWILFLVLGGFFCVLFIVTEIARRSKKTEENPHQSSNVSEKS